MEAAARSSSPLPALVLTSASGSDSVGSVGGAVRESRWEMQERLRAEFLRECCVGYMTLCDLHERSRLNGLVCVHLNTRDGANVLGVHAEQPRPSLENDSGAGADGRDRRPKRFFKHVFLKNPKFRADVIGYYRSLGYSYVDVVCLNGLDWKIFLWSPASGPHEHDARGAASASASARVVEKCEKLVEE